MSELNREVTPVFYKTFYYILFILCLDMTVIFIRLFFIVISIVFL